MRPGGLVVLADHWWPSVRTAERYFELKGPLDGANVDRETGEPRLRALRLPDPPFEPGFEAFWTF